MSFKLRYLTEDDSSVNSPTNHNPSNIDKFIAPKVSNDSSPSDNGMNLVRPKVEHSTSHISNMYRAPADTKPTFNDASKTQEQIDRNVTKQQPTFDSPEPNLGSNFYNRYNSILPS